MMKAFSEDINEYSNVMRLSTFIITLSANLPTSCTVSQKAKQNL